MSGDELVTALVEASSSLTYSVRSGSGASFSELERLRGILRDCALEWAEVDCIPRAAVNVLIDLQPSLLASAERYEAKERNLIVDLSIELGDLVRDAVSL